MDCNLVGKTEEEQQILIKAELDILKIKLTKLRTELITSTGGMDFMISCFEEAVRYAENVKDDLLPSKGSYEIRFEDIELSDADYLIRDNYACPATADYNEYCTHVSWTYKLLKEFKETLEEYQELHGKLI